MNYNDLRKLIESKSKTNDERISYEEFSTWLGPCINMTEGFYFRHDSVKNNLYEENLKKTMKKIEDNSYAYKDSTQAQLHDAIIQKIVSQWKTIRKAFIDINKNSGAFSFLSESELKYYLDHWGFKIT